MATPPPPPPPPSPSTPVPEINLTADLRHRLATADRAVVFTGAGVSQESGLATFRGGDDSLWSQYRPEELATPQAFAAHPDRVWQWYGWRHAGVAGASPNAGHHALVRFEALFPSYLLVTQNVDGLHQQAGSRGVVELHGTIRQACCSNSRTGACDRRMDMGKALERSPETPPRCECGGRLRPAVVWFGEPLPQGVMERAAAAAGRADLFLVVGTSATVYPAAGLIEIAHRAGAVVVEVNPEPSALSRLADLRVQAPAAAALPALEREVRRCRPTAT